MAANFVCPMHPAVRQDHPGACPECGMDLVPEGARFGMLRHMLSMPGRMLSSPRVLVLMALVMAALMAALLLR